MREKSNIRVENKESCEPLSKNIMILLQFMKAVCVAPCMSLFSSHIFPPNNWQKTYCFIEFSLNISWQVKMQIFFSHLPSFVLHWHWHHHAFIVILKYYSK